MCTFCNTPQCRRIMMLARRRCAPCSAHFACPAYLARLAVEWWRWWWVGLFIQPYTDPEWILTAAGLLYIYARNPIPGPPFSSPIPSFLFATPASSSDGRWRLLPPTQPSCRKERDDVWGWGRLGGSTTGDREAEGQEQNSI